LNPGGTYTIADGSRGDVGSHSNDLADWLMAEDSGERSGQVSERLMDVGITDAAGMHLHEHLVGAGLRLRNFSDLPRSAHSGNDSSLHNTSSYFNSMQASFVSVHDFGCPIRQSHTKAELDAQLANRRPS
jgi:hypothetical protein